ncbi:MAG TPA: hypothetical protein VFS02_02630 [Telluria sp.]|nr:hypothetical protein [Telluria sp.]
MIKPLFCWLGALPLLTSLAQANAATPAQSTAPNWEGRERIGLIMPVFSQLVRTWHPKGFQIAPVYEKVIGGQYIRETVLEGENTTTWTQMISIMGAKDLASNPDATPKKIADIIARGYKNSCPASFSAGVDSISKIDGRDAFVAMVSCGKSPLKQGGTSETALVIVIKGEKDYYTVKWSERGAPSTTPLAIDTAKWGERYKLLMPIHVCPIVPGEAAPYRSCVDRKSN